MTATGNWGASTDAGWDGGIGGFDDDYGLGGSLGGVADDGGYGTQSDGIGGNGDNMGGLGGDGGGYPGGLGGMDANGGGLGLGMGGDSDIGGNTDATGGDSGYDSTYGGLGGIGSSLTGGLGGTQTDAGMAGLGMGGDDDNTDDDTDDDWGNPTSANQQLADAFGQNFGFPSRGDYGGATPSATRDIVSASMSILSGLGDPTIGAGFNRSRDLYNNWRGDLGSRMVGMNYPSAPDGQFGPRTNAGANYLGAANMPGMINDSIGEMDYTPAGDSVAYKTSDEWDDGAAAALGYGIGLDPGIPGQMQMATTYDPNVDMNPTPDQVQTQQPPTYSVDGRPAFGAPVSRPALAGPVDGRPVFGAPQGTTQSALAAAVDGRPVFGAPQPGFTALPDELPNPEPQETILSVENVPDEIMNPPAMWNPEEEYNPLGSVMTPATMNAAKVAAQEQTAQTGGRGRTALGGAQWHGGFSAPGIASGRTPTDAGTVYAANDADVVGGVLDAGDPNASIPGVVNGPETPNQPGDLDYTPPAGYDPTYGPQQPGYTGPTYADPDEPANVAPSQYSPPATTAGKVAKVGLDNAPYLGGLSKLFGLGDIARKDIDATSDMSPSELRALEDRNAARQAWRDDHHEGGYLVDAGYGPWSDDPRYKHPDLRDDKGKGGDKDKDRDGPPKGALQQFFIAKQLRGPRNYSRYGFRPEHRFFKYPS